MYKVKSIATYAVPNRNGPVFMVDSPVSADRTQAAVLAAIGNKILIDGLEYKPVGVEMFMPATPVWVGERIGLLCELPE